MLLNVILGSDLKMGITNMEPPTVTFKRNWIMSFIFLAIIPALQSSGEAQNVFHTHHNNNNNNNDNNNNNGGVNNYREFTPLESLSSIYSSSYSPSSASSLSFSSLASSPAAVDSGAENENDLSEFSSKYSSLSSYPTVLSSSSFSPSSSSVASSHRSHNHQRAFQKRKVTKYKTLPSLFLLDDFDLKPQSMISVEQNDNVLVTFPTKNITHKPKYKSKIKSRFKPLKRKSKVKAKWRRHHRDVSSLSQSLLSSSSASSLLSSPSSSSSSLLSSMASLLDDTSSSSVSSFSSSSSFSESPSEKTSDGGVDENGKFYVTFQREMDSTPSAKVQTNPNKKSHTTALSQNYNNNKYNYNNYYFNDNNNNSYKNYTLLPSPMALSSIPLHPSSSSLRPFLDNDSEDLENSFQSDAEADNDNDNLSENMNSSNSDDDDDKDKDNVKGRLSEEGDSDSDGDSEKEEEGAFQPPSASANWPSTFEPGMTCRHHMDLPPLAYQLNTCAYCYQYIPNKEPQFLPDRKYRLLEFAVSAHDPLRGDIPVHGLWYNNSIVLANISDSKSPLISTFGSLETRKKWIHCCEAAEKCCKKIQKLSTAVQSENSSDEKKCPATWDGWTCWSDTQGGENAEAFCPHYIFFMTEQSSCITTFPKVCMEDGSWQKRNTSKGLQEWTNYMTCATAGITLQKKRTHVHIIAYAVSIVALIPALGVFFVYKQLRTHRIILHRNLFLSMLLNGLLVILFRTTVILNDLESDSKLNSVINENGIGCRILLILTKYSRMTNYMWCFCEGYYLHKLISAAFAEQKSLLVFYLLGWGFPIIPTAVYAGLRLYNANNQCWVTPEIMYEWVLNLPSLLSLLINLGFLINIIRVLVTKIRATTHTTEPSQYRKAVRATLVLLPLFGLHFLLTIYRVPTGDCEWIELYYYMNNVLDGLQGFLVALIFCYANGEVVELLKRSYARWREQHNAGCTRQQSRLGGGASNGGGGRNGRGRSVVSTYYSSVPASPTQTRLTITNAEMTTVGGLLTPGSSVGAGSIGGGSGTTPPYSNSNLNANSNLGKDEKVKMTNGNSVSLLVTNVDTGTWSEIKLGGDNEDSLEMKQAFALNPSQISNSTTTSPKNGILNEHQL